VDREGWLTDISGSVDAAFLLRNEQAVAENRILRDPIKGRVQLNNAEGQTRSESRQKPGKKALEAVVPVVNPDTDCVN
jgi:hypothetical protein